MQHYQSAYATQHRKLLQSHSSVQLVRNPSVCTHVVCVNEVLTMATVGAGDVPLRHGTRSRHTSSSRPTSPHQDYSIADTQAVCRLAQEHPRDTHTEMPAQEQREMGITVPAGTISRILRNRDRWTTAHLLSRRRLREGKHNYLEQSLTHGGMGPQLAPPQPCPHVFIAPDAGNGNWC